MSRTFGQRVARQFDQLPRTDVDREELSGQFRNLVRFVQDEGVCAGQDVAETFLFQREIGEQQVMIDHHDVGFLRAPPRLDHEAVVEKRAFRAQAVLRGRGHTRPQRRGLRHLGEFRAITAARAAAPRADRLQIICLRARFELPVLRGLLQPIQAQVIGASFQQRGIDFDAQHRTHPRQIAMEQLILQIARAGGNDHALARQQRGHQIRKGLAGAGAGLGHQRTALVDGRGHRIGHALLRIARREVGQLACERTVCAEQRRDGMAIRNVGHRSGFAVLGNAFSSFASIVTSLAPSICASATNSQS